jgi:hypothetical protein
VGVKGLRFSEREEIEMDSLYVEDKTDCGLIKSGGNTPKVKRYENVP